MQALLAHRPPGNTFFQLSVQREAGKSTSDNDTGSPSFRSDDAFCWSRATTAEASPEVSEVDSPSDEQNLVMDNAPSIGSMGHHLGRCNPCAWHWKPQGCTKGSNCTRCHLCPDGELKARKKAKKAALQAARSDGGSESQVEVAVPHQRAPLSLVSSLILEEPAYLEYLSANDSEAAATQADEESCHVKAPEGDIVFPAKVSIHGPKLKNSFIQFETDYCDDLVGSTPSGNLPVKNTFIQFDIEEDDDSRDRDAPPHHSAPGLLQGGARSFPRIVKRTEQRSPSPRQEADVEVVRRDAAGGDIDDDAGDKLSESSSSTVPENMPSALENAKSAREEMELLHMAGECTPCAYFWYKKDGCRQGSDCTFCHLCPKGEIKKRKKHKIRTLKAEGVFRVS